MGKVLEECQEEAYELIIKKAFFQLEDLKDLKTLNYAISLCTLFANDENLQEKLVEHEYFIPQSQEMTGKELQFSTIFGRMLSVTVWPTENQNMQFQGLSKTSPGGHQKMKDNVSQKFYAFYDSFVTMMKKMLKNKAVKDKVLQWFRTLINLNTEYFKMMPQMVKLSSKGCFINALSIFLELCAPFTSKLDKYHANFEKVDPLY
jgi:hypothetical protein